MREVRCPVLVGRDAELEALAAGIERAAHGGGEVVCLLGEAGVGKSRLASVAAAIARSAGMAVLRGRAAPSPAPTPYRPVGEALLSTFRATGLPAAPELDGFGAALGVLVPAWSRPGVHRPAEPSVILLGEAALARCLVSFAPVKARDRGGHAS